MAPSTTSPTGYSGYRPVPNERTPLDFRRQRILFVTFTLAEPNPFERATVNATRAVHMAEKEPEKAKAKFLVAQRRGTLDSHPAPD